MEEDTIPLHLMARDPAAPPALGQVVVQRDEWLQRFATWVFALQPDVWEEIRNMASTSTDGPRLDWDKIGKYVNLDEVVRSLPPDRVIQILGVERAIQVIGLDRVLGSVGLPRVIEAVGPSRFIETMGLSSLIESSGAEKVLDELLAHVSPEQLQEMLRRRQQQG